MRLDKDSFAEECAALGRYLADRGLEVDEGIAVMGQMIITLVQDQAGLRRFTRILEKAARRQAAEDRARAH